MNDLVDRINAAAKELGMDSSIAELAERFVNDKRARLEGAYLFGQTKENESSVFKAARELHDAGLAKKFYVSSGNAEDGYPGYPAWRERLAPIIGYENVLPVPIPEGVQADNVSKGLKSGNVNTGSESKALVYYAGLNDMPVWHAASSEFHFMRAFMTLVSRIKQHGQDMSVYFTIGGFLPWDDIVPHSQGRQVKARSELLKEDLAKIRIPAYGILSPKEIIGYMDRRTLPPQPPQPLNSGGPARQS